MQFTICSSDYIAYHASALTRAVLANSRRAMNMVVESLVTTAVAQLEYTRSVAILSRQISNRLRCEDALLAHKFTEGMADAVVGAFFAYWAERKLRIAPGYAPKRTADAVDPIALCAFVGDLFSTGVLPFTEFEECVSTLLSIKPSTLLLECLCAVFAHGGAYHHPAMTPAYLLACIGAIERKCAAYRRIEFFEATKVTAVIGSIMFRAKGEFIKDVVDKKLNLDTALARFPCIDVVDVHMVIYKE
ncbi:hypothetical protein HYPSUDRAFT_204584 [Hypholoma sublateritium FD-334 SS-4]|uniref:Uncharacterized protein n=1 Tax=Hypholoma sublateritium (strain FD-334 SS-4) TaxID=945553 RepID=A0A0D2KXV6_HYPSF|nr:hypothetical protein HYPSUDRAFT_204584 [Hypholoma sublateritium FD-334 SS-4]